MSTCLRLAVVAAVLATSACNKAPEPAAVPATPAPVATPQAADAPATATPPPAEAGTAVTAIDTCALLDRAAAEAIAGPLTGDPVAGTPTGSLLGECKYLGASTIITVDARPAGEFDASVRAMSRAGGAKAVEGLAGPATWTSMGVLMQPAGKPYFLHVFAMGTSGVDEAMSIAAAQALKL